MSDELQFRDTRAVRDSTVNTAAAGSNPAPGAITKAPCYLKRDKVLGMNYSTAYQRLLKDLLFDLMCKSGQNSCFVCSREMSRKDFTIEHKKSWLLSEDPYKYFFSLDNISFSHHACNMSRRSRPSEEEKRATKEKAKVRKAEKARKKYSTEKRRERRRKTGH